MVIGSAFQFFKPDGREQEKSGLGARQFLLLRSLLPRVRTVDRAKQEKEQDRCRETGRAGDPCAEIENFPRIDSVLLPNTDQIERRARPHP